MRRTSTIIVLLLATMVMIGVGSVSAKKPKSTPAPENTPAPETTLAPFTIEFDLIPLSDTWTTIQPGQVLLVDHSDIDDLYVGDGEIRAALVEVSNVHLLVGGAPVSASDVIPGLVLVVSYKTDQGSTNKSYFGYPEYTKSYLVQIADAVEIIR